MTKVNNSSTLIELKLAVINYHDGENMNYLQKNIARDACYTCLLYTSPSPRDS